MKEAGLAHLDEEHRRFLSLVEELDSAIAQHKGKREVERQIRALMQEAAAHFRHEARLLSELEYPHAGRHIAAHARLESQLWDALRLSYATEPDADWAKKGMVIKQMLLEHLQLEDPEYRGYVLSRSGAGSEAG
jgi:hemerythrin